MGVTTNPLASPRNWLAGLSLALGLTFGAPSVQAEEPPALRSGALVIAGGGILPPSIYQRFIELGGGPDARLVIITTASGYAGTAEMETRTAIWREYAQKPYTLFHAPTRKEADDPEFCSVLDRATAVWITGGNQNYLCERYLGTRVEDALQALLKRGGVVGGTSAGAAIMSRSMIAGGKHDPIMATGFGLLPGTIIDQHFLRRNRGDRLDAALRYRPGHVGIGIDEETALVCRPDSYEVIGNSDVVMCLAPSPSRPSVSQRIATGSSIELSKWSLAAQGRARLEAYAKAEQRPTPNVTSGAVVIAGNHPPKAALEQFLALAGGKTAPVVLVADSMDDPPESRQRLEAFFAEAGAENVVVCSANDEKSLSDPKVHQTLAIAKGVWFVGGREQQLMTGVAQSPLQKVVSKVLERGGAVGGSSAGAMIHGEGLVQAAAKDDYFDCGLGLLAGLVIHPHCREPEAGDAALAGALRERYPQCLGLELKESSAVIVRGQTMQVVGPEAVSIIDQATTRDENPAREVVQSGQAYDFAERRLVTSATEVLMK
jgi:cyanophycinase